MKLSGHHRTTLEQLFSHPVSHNVHWRDALSLLEAVGTITQLHGGGVSVALGDGVRSLSAPHGHHERALDEDQVLELRKLLEGAGITPGTVE